MKNRAFTLAEVLITLGIIGVVSAMTIPTLIQNYNTKTWNTSAKVFNRKLEEALKTMNTQQTLAGHATTESFVEELSKHFKTNKICSNDRLLDCFSETVYWGGGEAAPEEVDMSIVKTSKNLGQKDWNTNIVGVQFANGVSAMIAYNPITSGDDACTQDPYSNEVTGADCLAILYDTSGSKNPNTIGKDLRANANVKNLGTGCVFEIGGTCYTTNPITPVPHMWKGCQSDGTTTDAEDVAFMSEYNIKRCCVTSKCMETGDYWAGAVKTCGGKDKMPTNAQLTELANYVYNTDSVASSGQTTELSLDANKVLSLGLSLNTSEFYFWSGSEFTEQLAYARGFKAVSTSRNYDYRHYSSRLVVCIDN